MNTETDRLPRRAIRGRTSLLRPLLLSGLLLGGLGLNGAEAQRGAGAAVTAQVALPQKPALNGEPGPSKPLSEAETQKLGALFAKVRPATLRIEQCNPRVARACDDPDGIGSAVLISADGLALTAYHVIERAENLSAQTLNKKRYAVEVVGYDDQYDLALLRVAVPKGTPFLPLASARPGIGDAVLAVGNGGGAFLASKVGRLTGLDADAGRADFPPGTLQMNAPLVPGDSGGPILNVRGELTGIVSYISLGQGRERSSFAVPVTTYDARLAALRTGTKRDAPVIGVTLDNRFNWAFMLDEDGFEYFSNLLNLGQVPGAFFSGVSQDSPAQKAGLKPLVLNGQDQRISGDIVTEVNGKRVLNFSEFQYAVRTYAPGDTVILTVLRGPNTLKIPLKLIGRSTIGN
ncbi:S1C family serine protease [Deinococcus arenicola]|uniref:S1C family serine protease n=1 Tax=Deinococcus arenicola TaxID=2994950 RepID=A0ABU4DRZ7_9DEIO|nr:S1C family serine protease [Deinococcus sp. ZS9-10]MDV6374864.1 S1C family serine protease [Deinococcus sp. ZS9-10]